MKTTQKIRLVVLLAIISAIPVQSFAQSDALVQAFSASYQAEKKGNYATAITPIKNVYDVNSYEINLRMAYLYYMAGFSKESIGYYQVAINLQPQALEPRFGIVYPMAALGQTDGLIAQYSAILQLDPANTVALYRMGYIYYQKKELNTAYTYYEKLVKLYPFSYDGLSMLARVANEAGNKTEALALYNRLILLVPGDKDAQEALKKLKS